MSRKPSKPETRIEDYLDVMTGGNAALPQPILRIEFYYAFLAGMTVELPQPILDDEKLLAKICGMEVEAPTYIPGLFPRLYAYMAKKGGQDVQVPDPILRLERYWYDYTAGSPASVQEYTGAVPVTFVADGTPLLDYIISGNTVQSGTPTPDSPIMPQGTGERTGNLAKYWKAAYVTASGAVNANRVNGVSFPVKLEAGQTVSFTNQKANFGRGIAIFSEFDGETLTNMIYRSTNNTVTYTADSDCYVIIWGNYDNTTSMDEAVFNLCCQMLNLGSTALPYEPYGIKIPISSANTTTPVYLGEVETTRQIREFVLDGTENWFLSTAQAGRFGLSLSDYLKSNGTITSFCSHYMAIAQKSSGTVPNNSQYFYSGSDAARYIFIVDERYTTAADFKTYLAAQYAAGTPVTIWYVLATEETAVVNEPLMRIGDYADTLSMEQAGVSIPTANGSTTLDVETAVKPSEVYIKYRGEAVATLSTLSAEVSSPEAIPAEENPEETEEEENEH